MSAIKFNSHKDCQSTGTGGEWNGIVDKDILPSKPGINIGSPTQRFDTIYVDDAMLSTNTLYLGDTPVMGTDQDTIVIKADKDQSIAVKTTGVGSTKIISESSVELSTDGQNADVVFQTKGNGARTILSSAYAAEVTAPSINLNGNTKVKGNTHVEQLTVDGNIIVNGESFEINSTTLTVEDNIIEINKGQVGQGVSLGCAGIKIDRGDSPDYMLIFDETDDKLKAGLNGDLKIVATEEFVLNNSSNVDLSDYYNKTETDEKLLLKAETEHAHEEYAIKTDIHTKAEVEAKLLLKANQETTYTKEEVNAIIEEIEPPTGSTHVHNNKEVIDKFEDIDGTLSYNGQTLINNNEDTKKLMQEITQARIDYWGKEHATLEQRLNSDYKDFISNNKKIFSPQKGKGSITVKNTFEGSVKNLVIKGSTVGGYNSELSTSFPLQSVGQAEGNKISILSRNKNLSGNVIDGAWDISNGNFLPDVKGICNDEFIKLNKGNYVFTKQKGTCWFVDSALHSFEITTNNLNIPNDGLYKWYILGEDLNKNVQLEQGTIPSSYSPPQQDKKDILLPFEGGLKKINNVSDIIYEGSIIQKIGSNILDGRLTYDIGDSSGDYVRFNINEASLGIKNGTVNLLCDKLNFVDRNTLFTGNMEGISVYLVSSGPTYMFAKILKSRLNGNITSEGIKKYFDSNIHKFNYELATPITHEIPSQKLSTFKPLTTLSVETEVEADVEGEFPVKL